MDGVIRDLTVPDPALGLVAEVEDPEGCPAAAPRAVFWIGSGAPPRLRELLAKRGLALQSVESGATLRASGPAVLCFGPDASPAEVKATLDALQQCATIVLAADGAIGEFQELLDSDRLFYLSRGALSERDLAALIESAADSVMAPAAAAAPAALDRFLSADVLRRLALAQSLSDLADGLRAAIMKGTSARRGRCVLFDRERQMLWVPAGGSEPDSGESTAVGLVSFILRTGATVCLPHVGDDPRFDRELDDPDGDPSDRFLGVPIRVGRGEVVAVLVALRPAHEQAFEPLEIAAMEAIAAHATPYLAAWLGTGPADGASPYRQRALRELELPMSAGPEPLRLEPKWTHGGAWLVALTFAALLLALVLVFALAPGLEGWRNG